MNTKNGKRDADDLLAVLRMMLYIVRELELLGHANAAEAINATALQLQKSNNITDAQLFPPPPNDD